MRRGPGRSTRRGPTVIRSGSFHGGSIGALTAQDVRYTRNKAGTIVYAFMLGWPEGAVVLRSLGSAAQTKPGRIEHVELLGSSLPPAWRQAPEGLQFTLPGHRPAIDFAATLQVHLAA